MIGGREVKMQKGEQKRDDRFANGVFLSNDVVEEDWGGGK